MALITSLSFSLSPSSSSSLADLNQTEPEMVVAYKSQMVGIIANELETKINKSGEF